ncbi:MAG: UPF0175 family protein [Desulfuromonadales bacterium]
MQHSVSIECPAEILIGLHTDAQSFGEWMKLQSAIVLFKEGKVSSGMAGKWLNMPRIEFIRKAMEQGAVLLDDSQDDFERETSLL